ncbi:hypothetical protein LCGC14_1047730 [marine sediment metagenome]|uniref:DNA-directed DNA polymerase n=1 Tax=marine sediment metagenome TaxID=412755 RepID=A0A0F9MU89_9ZZZZ
MITTPNKPNFHIVEAVSELPNLRGRAEIFCDVETKRVFQHGDIGGMYPWKGDKICGIAISADDERDVWYVPVRHTIPGTAAEDNTGGPWCGVHVKENLPVENVMRWVTEILTSCDEWINHNVKFDAMFFAVGDGVMFDCRLIDTLTLSKLYYSDRFTYDLKTLCRDWLEYATESQDRCKIYRDSIKTKSFADTPIVMLGEYACDDVQMNRELYRFLQKHLKERDLASGDAHRGLEPQLIETEKLLTPVLFDMEYDGICIDETACQIESVKSLRKMILASEKIESATGSEFTNSNTCLKRILLDQFKLPILLTIIEKEDGHFVDTGRPSFAKDAMALYKEHPSVTGDSKIKEIVDHIAAYRIEQQFKSLFLDTFLRLHVGGIMHPNYNQCVRTGRLSCSRPNSQQQNSRSKKLILPHSGEGFFSDDYSQIEYRLTVHYCRIKSAIEAYINDSTTDFHQWVADLFEIHRKPAKGLNFGVVYGQGKRGVVASLMTDPDIMAKMGTIVNGMVANGSLSEGLKQIKFQDLCKRHGESAYAEYHATMPEIKKTSDAAKDVAKVRGFVFTAYGRRRYLPGNAARKAFNSVAQGCISPDQYILTKEHGYSQIKDCVGPVQVWNGESFVSGHVVNSGAKKKVQTLFSDNTNIVTSPEHRFYTIPTVGNCKWKTPDQFSKVERVAMSTEMPAWATGRKLESIPTTECPSQPNGVWNTNDYSWEDIASSYDRGLMLGRLASDGTFTNHQAVWLIAEHEKSILPVMEGIIKKTGWKYVVKKKDRRKTGRLPMYHLRVSSVKLKEQLRYLNIKNQVSRYLYSNSELLVGFLKGFFDGDGTVGSSISLCFGKRHVATCLPDGIQRALRIFGIQSRVHCYSQVVRLHVSTKCSELFRDRIGFLNSTKQNKIGRVVSKKKFHNDIPASIVDFVIPMPGDVEMFDVVDVPQHKFMCEGLIVHNTSADIIKERMVALAPRYNSDTRRMGISPRANVHDELLSGVPLESLHDLKVQNYMCDMLEDTSTKFRVPIRVGLGISAKNWSEAAGDETTYDADGKPIAGKIH